MRAWMIKYPSGEYASRIVENSEREAWHQLKSKIPEPYASLEDEDALREVSKEDYEP